MNILNRKKRPANELSQSISSEKPTSRQSLSVSMPMYHLVKLRKYWLTLMLLIGAFSQFLLAIYAPEVWNYIYGLIQRFVPIL